MKLNVGFEMVFDCPKPTPMIFNLNVHYTRVSDLIGRDVLLADPPVPMTAYRDDFGNWCTRIVAPKGYTRIRETRSSQTAGSPTSWSRGAPDTGRGPARRDAHLPAG